MIFEKCCPATWKTNIMIYLDLILPIPTSPDKQEIMVILILIRTFYSAYKKWRHTIEMTNDRPIHRPNIQLQANISFNWPMVGQYNVIFIGTVQAFFSKVFFINLRIPLIVCLYVLSFSNLLHVKHA